METTPQLVKSEAVTKVRVPLAKFIGVSDRERYIMLVHELHATQRQALAAASTSSRVC